MSISTSRCDSPLGEITLITITNREGSSVTLSSLGAGIVSIVVPDADGAMADVALGYKDPADYIADGPCCGKVPGRFANRIAKGLFSLNGKDHTLAINNGPNALHGGPTGFMNRIWDVRTVGDDTVEFTYTSADGEEGYPGKLGATARYTWTDDCRLILTLEAETDAPTVINLTNHAYFNLEGEGSGTALHHELRLAASRYLPTDPTQIPTGELAPVSGTPMDFTVFKPLGRDVHADFEAIRIGKGYDHCFVVDGADGSLREVAWLRSPRTTRTLTISSTQPALQLYTGNWLAGCPTAKSGCSYTDYDGVAIECQNYPDAPNHPHFPSPVLNPGETYSHVIEFKFNR